MKRGLYALRPALKRVLWGGNRLQKHYGKDASATERIGESWEASAVVGMESVDIASGLNLAELWQRERVHLGGMAAPTEFPLLLKLLHCEQPLSVQVHPDDAQASAISGGSCGKLEAWVVLEAPEGAAIHIGLNPGCTPEDLQRAVSSGSNAVRACLREFRAQRGDVWLVEPGVVHAPGAGVVLLEVQQPSDLTYRVYDWERCDAQGHARPLQVEAAMRIMKSGGPEGPVACIDNSLARQPLVRTHAFALEHWAIDGVREELIRDMTLLHVLEGTPRISAMGETRLLQRGATCLIPRGATIARIEGESVRLAAVTRGLAR